MTNKPLDPVVRAWLKDTDAKAEDVGRSARIISSRAERTPQRGRWWPLPSFRRRPSRSAAIVASDDQLGVPPNLDSHSALVNGRTQPMFSPVKAITAGAIVFAVGGVLLIAQPFGRQGDSAPGAAGSAAPVEVTGSAHPGPCPGEDVTGEAGSIRTTRDGWCNPSWNLDDPRLNGTVTYAGNLDEYLDANGLTIGLTGVSIVNDEGAWRLPPWVAFEGAGVVAPGPLPGQFVLVGEGGYDGLFAVLAFDGLSGGLHGFIVEGTLPPAPEVTATS